MGNTLVLVILRACRAGRFFLVTTPQLLEELTRVLTYARLRVIARHPDLPQILRWLHDAERIVFPRRGIEIVHQDLALCNNLTAAANVFLGRELKRRHARD